MRQLTLSTNGGCLQLKNDVWINDDDIDALRSSKVKRRRTAPFDASKSVEWADLDKNELIEPGKIQLTGIIVQIKHLVKAKWIKLYVKRGGDVGVCLMENLEETFLFKIGICVVVIIDRIIGKEFDKTISSHLCTKSVGILTYHEIVAVNESSDAQLSFPAAFPWAPLNCMTLLESFQAIQTSNATLRAQLDVRHVEATFYWKGKQTRQYIRVADQAGGTASLVLNGEQTDIVGLKEGSCIIMTGFSISFYNGRFQLYLGQNSAIELLKMDGVEEESDRKVPEVPKKMSIVSVLDEAEAIPDNSEITRTLEVMITELDLKNSVFAKCSECIQRQRVQAGGKCKKCGSSGKFADARFDVRIAVADGSGQWSGLALSDRQVRCFFLVAPFDASTQEIQNEWILSWVKMTVSLTKVKNQIGSEIISLTKPFKS